MAESDAAAAAGAASGVALLVHGGAGDMAEARVPRKLQGVRAAAAAGYAVLREGGSAANAVEAAVRVMEDDCAFNAGYGSVLNLDEEVEMDALFMEGDTLNAGAVGALKDVRSAIAAARAVQKHTPHVLLVGEAARRVALQHGGEPVPPGALVTQQARNSLARARALADTTHHETTAPDGEGGTVGAVAVDASGRTASATSTGGTSGKMAGRVGDTALVGCGGYADDTVGCVSTTGHGESIIKTNLAHAIIVLMRQGVGPQEAAECALEEMRARTGQTAGAVVLSAAGEAGVAFVSRGMTWALRSDAHPSTVHYGVWHGQRFVDDAAADDDAAARDKGP